MSVHHTTAEAPAWKSAAVWMGLFFLFAAFIILNKDFNTFLRYLLLGLPQGAVIAAVERPHLHQAPVDLAAGRHDHGARRAARPQQQAEHEHGCAAAAGRRNPCRRTHEDTSTVMPALSLSPSIGAQGSPNGVLAASP